MNFPTSGGVPEPGKQLMIDALNFSDMGYDVTGPQVHADGEIWSKTNFAIRQLLIDKYDDDYPAGDQELQTECAEGYVPAHRCPGNRRWIQLVFDAMLLMPTNPTMLQARDAALTADLMRFGGANQKELWLGYARQGMGVNAASSNTTANTDIDPTPDFEPGFGTTPATVNFEVENSDRDDVNARIYVGHYETRVSPIADTNPATSGINLDATAKFAPGTYELIAHAPGYGFHRFRETFRSGRTHNIEIELPTNWASMTSGATASTTDGAATVNNLIDDTEGTSWIAPATNVGGAISVDGKTAAIDLGGTNAVRVRYIQVSAMLSAGNSRFSALRSFEIWACNNKGAGDCTTNAGYSKVYSSPDNAFPGDPPRPVAPHLILRKFNVPDFSATHIRFVVKTSQCTGTPAFQGNQDADPANDADCDTNVAANSTRNLVRSAELQVFRSNADIDLGLAPSRNGERAGIAGPLSSASSNPWGGEGTSLTFVYEGLNINPGPLDRGEIFFSEGEGDASQDAWGCRSDGSPRRDPPARFCVVRRRDPRQRRSRRLRHPEREDRADQCPAGPRTTPCWEYARVVEPLRHAFVHRPVREIPGARRPRQVRPGRGQVVPEPAQGAPRPPLARQPRARQRDEADGEQRLCRQLPSGVQGSADE